MERSPASRLFRGVCGPLPRRRRRSQRRARAQACRGAPGAPRAGSPAPADAACGVVIIKGRVCKDGTRRDPGQKSGLLLGRASGLAGRALARCGRLEGQRAAAACEAAREDGRRRHRGNRRQRPKSARQARRRLVTCCGVRLCWPRCSPTSAFGAAARAAVTLAAARRRQPRPCRPQSALRHDGPAGRRDLVRHSFVSRHGRLMR